MEPTTSYLNYILPQIPRILSQIDTNPVSPNYGCVDRAYWHYKTNIIPNARYQEVALTLSLLYQNKFRNNIYYQSAYILEITKAILHYWKKIQLSDGSYNEWYAHEHSFVATAFSLYAVTESLLVLNLKIVDFEASINKAATWLTQAKMQPASNQIAGAVVALHTVFELTQNNFYNQAAQNKLLHLSKIQTSEGWLPEYGGADIGYSSVLLDYLSKYHQKNQDSVSLKIAKKLLLFLSYCIHPDFSAGGNYGSRNTAYLIPAGIEYFAHYSKDAQSLLSAIRKRHRSHPMNLDDRYLCYNGYTFVQAGLQKSNIQLKKPPAPKFQQKFTKKFPLAGLYIKSTAEIYMILQIKKGGVLVIFDKQREKLIYSFAGFIGQLVGGTIVSTQYLSPNWKATIGQNSITVSGNFFKINTHPTQSLLVMGFHSFQLTLGRLLNQSDLIKSVLRKRLITQSYNLPIRYRQRITFDQKSLSITHTISSDKQQQFNKLWLQNSLELIYVPSSHFFDTNVLKQKTVVFDQQALKKLNHTHTFSFTQQILLES